MCVCVSVCACTRARACMCVCMCVLLLLFSYFVCVLVFMPHKEDTVVFHMKLAIAEDETPQAVSISSMKRGT